MVLAAAIAAVKAGGGRMRDQRVVIYGAGTAGMAIADMLRDVMVRDGLSQSEATRSFWAVDRPGLLTSDSAPLRDFQLSYARPAAEVATWSLARPSQRDHPCRCGGEYFADDADRHVHSYRRVQRNHRAADGCRRGTADHHAAVQPDLEG